MKIQKIKDEENDEYSNDDLYNIDSWGSDPTFRELITMIDEGELLKPALQRNYVWKKYEASRFIESLLLGLPVPSIFLTKTDEEKALIVDGFQRIMTVEGYVKGVFPGDNKKFTLSSSDQINLLWRGKTFAELESTLQRKIKMYNIHAITFRQREPRGDTSIYQIFERINTGGIALNPQEIRNCIYHGKFNDLLLELNKNIKWRTLFGGDKEDERMRDIEFILRFITLKSTKLEEI